jgi:outer membrane protein assembly factor BamB
MQRFPIQLLSLLVLTPAAAASAEPSPDWTPIPIIGKSEEVARFAAPEARQGVAVDADHIYVIGNHEIGKYRKGGFAKVASWSCPEGEPLIHLNAGIILDGQLYTSHSNYPGVPMLSSVEVFDPETLEHVDSHSFGRGPGSHTWLDRRAGDWYAFFAHYANRAAEPDRDPSWSELVRYDSEWRRLEGWLLPQAILERVGKYSASGGAFGPGGYLYITGHDAQELYVLTFPKGGGRLEVIGRVPIQAEGQAFAFDPEDPRLVYTILKRTREVIVERLTLTFE